MQMQHASWCDAAERACTGKPMTLNVNMGKKSSCETSDQIFPL